MSEQVEGTVVPEEVTDEVVTEVTEVVEEAPNEPSGEVLEPTQDTESLVEGNEGAGPGEVGLSAGSVEGNDSGQSGEASDTTSSLTEVEGSEDSRNLIGFSENDDIIIETPAESEEDKLNALACSTYEAHYKTPWAEVSLVDREAHVHLVARVLAAPEKTADDFHQEFVDLMVASGWTFGPVESEREKVSPFVVPFNALTDELRDDYEVLISVIKSHVW